MVNKRFIRWARAGVWQMIFNILAVDQDTEWLMIDSTKCISMCKKKMWKLVDKKKSWDDVNSSKLHAACDALGNQLRFFVTAGQKSDYVKALDLIDCRCMEALIADKMI